MAVVKPWKRDLAYIREVGPDEPRFDAAVQRVWDRCEQTNDPEGPLASDNPTSGEGSEFRRREEAYRVSADTEALLATVREALPGLRNLTEGYSYEYALAYYQREEGFDAIAALDSLAAELERVKAEADDKHNALGLARVRLDKALAALRKINKGMTTTTTYEAQWRSDLEIAGRAIAEIEGEA